MNNKNKLIIGVTGASGSIYAKTLITKLESLNNQIDECSIILSESAKKVWEYELENRDYEKIVYNVYNNDNFFSSVASGSAQYNKMIICPCSMGTMGKISNGISDNLICRAADVILKERKKLVLLLREMPFNLIHIKNMKNIIEAGGIICSAAPSFYSRPKSIDELVNTVIDRLLILSGYNLETFEWG